jgi:hypothetical protein
MFAAEAIGDEVKLKSGDVLHGNIVDRTGSHVVLHHPDHGRMVLPADKVDFVTEDPPAGARSEPPIDRTKPADEDEWTLGIGLGGSYTNDDEGPDLDLNFRVAIARRSAESRTELDKKYILGSKNHKDTDNSFTGILDQRWLVGGTPWSWLAQARYDFDSFRSWRHRVTAHAGAAYALVSE